VHPVGIFEVFHPFDICHTRQPLTRMSNIVLESLLKGQGFSITKHSGDRMVIDEHEATLRGKDPRYSLCPRVQIREPAVYSRCMIAVLLNFIS
jgi:hypothetical protein